MTNDEFWALVSDADELETKLAETRRRLSSLRDEDLAAYIRKFRELDVQLATPGVYHAAYLLGEGCSDDGFRDFRALIIALGCSAHTAAVERTDSLASVPHLDVGFEEFRAVAHQIWQDRFKTHFDDSQLVPLPALSSVVPALWTPAQIRERLPRLCHLVGF